MKPIGVPITTLVCPRASTSIKFVYFVFGILMPLEESQSQCHPLNLPTNSSSFESFSAAGCPSSLKHAQQQSRLLLRNGELFTTIDDHTWKYTFETESYGGIVTGFGNALIPSDDGIAKLVNRKLSIRAITWNINEKPVGALDLLINHMKLAGKLEDMILIALQEISPSNTTFHVDFTMIASKVLHHTHVTYMSYRAWSQMVLIFIRKYHIRFATKPLAKFVSVNTLPKPIRTKGAIGVCFRIYQRWTVIIACHLSHSSLLQRIQDYHKVMKSLKFNTLYSYKGSFNIFHADCVLWMGDLNFRITERNVQWRLHLQRSNSSDIENSIANDELTIIRRKDTKCILELAFNNFSEAPIKFAPTYKFELGTTNYVPNRIPSYTDRILFWTKNASWIECTSYDCIQEKSQSDHRPVYAIFQLEAINEKSPARRNKANQQNYSVNTKSP
ncbi:endonuclease/exonuclease/phosphatase family protein [Dictyocaulus viviparus]|uniref:Endonuclease/exonuclease/phosphatase family protein n=1 Tax=Dictyocaulus viviparus TaxID=29172 RepID=A0A0D8Y4G1_DICVI|nr:endonuclease/exonuclease/phosphatase family protein [Dictyocaulus viviparus]